MNQEPPVLAEARLGSRLGTRHWHAQLTNGAPVIAHLPRGVEGGHTTGPGPNAMVRLEMTPFDFSKGRIVAWSAAGPAIDSVAASNPVAAPDPAASPHPQNGDGEEYSPATTSPKLDSGSRARAYFTNMSAKKNSIENDKSSATETAEAVEEPATAAGTEDHTVPEPGTEVEKASSNLTRKASSAAQQVADKARDLGQTTQEKISEFKHSATERGNALKHSAGERANALKHSAGERADNLRREAGQKWTEGRDRAGCARREAEDYVRANPLPTVVGAFAVGLVVGAILRR